MALISDSNAILDTNRDTSQHFAICTFVRHIVSNPQLSELSWLDLGCGKGQLITTLSRSLDTDHRSKISLLLADADANHIKQAEQIAQGFSFSKVDSRICEFQVDIENFSTTHDVITIANVIHELNPFLVPSLIAHSLRILKDGGYLLICDMERLPSDSLELGAVPWSSDEIGKLLRSMLDSIGCKNYKLSPSRIQHSKTSSWLLNISKSYIKPSFSDQSAQIAIAAGQAAVADVLNQKLLITQNALESMTRFGIEAAGEVDDRTRLLFDYWALNRAQRTK